MGVCINGLMGLSGLSFDLGLKSRITLDMQSYMLGYTCPSGKMISDHNVYVQDQTKQKLIADEVEKIESIPADTTVPFRERLKILGRVVNIDDLCLNTTERALIHKHSEKPILSRPQPYFYSEHNK